MLSQSDLSIPKELWSDVIIPLCGKDLATLLNIALTCKENFKSIIEELEKRIHLQPIQITTGYKYTLFLFNSEELYACGKSTEDNYFGLGEKSLFSTNKITFPCLGPIQSLQSGNFNTILKIDNSWWGSGESTYGPIQGFNQIDSFNKIALSDIGVIDQIYSKSDQIFIISNHNLWACGYNIFGALGLGHHTSIINFAKVVIDMVGKIKDVIPSYYRTFVKDEQDNIYVSGCNYEGRAGLGREFESTNRFIKVKIPKEMNASPTVLGIEYATFLMTKDQLYVCGLSDNGALGLGETTKTDYKFMKVDTIKLGSLKKIAGGNDFIIIQTDLGLFGCGTNSYGQLGLGNIRKVKTLQKLPVDHLGVIENVECGKDWTILTTKQGIYGCGNNADGQLGCPNSIGKVNAFTKIEFEPHITQQLNTKKLHYLLSKNMGSLFSKAKKPDIREANYLKHKM